jgi:hypothetical protein
VTAMCEDLLTAPAGVVSVTVVCEQTGRHLHQLQANCHPCCCCRSLLLLQVGADEGVLYRVLRAASSMGVFREAPEGRAFAATPATALLRVSRRMAKGRLLYVCGLWLWLF